MLSAGHSEADGRVGVQVGAALPLAHVLRIDGRCYLQNGFHRAVGLRAAGAAAMPCLVRDAASPDELGLGHGTFDRALLESANPPTLGHFTQGRAHPVRLRAMSRIVHVSWAEYLVADE